MQDSAWIEQMKRAPHPFEELSYKAARRLIEAGYTSRAQVLEAVQAGQLSLSAGERPRQYGRILHRQVLCWLGLPADDQDRSGDWGRKEPWPAHPSYTKKQGQYLAFIYYYTKVNGRPPAEADFRRYFEVSPPSVHDMILTLEREGYVSRVPGQGRSIALQLTRNQLPDLE